MYTIPFLDLPPLRAALGSVTLPGSKSISNRILLMAALAEGRTEIHGLLDADDTQVMLASLRSLGVEWQRDGSVVSVQGMAGRVPQKQADLFLGNAGTAMRPLAAALALLAARDGGNYQLRGVPRMHERPIGDLVDALRGFGCRIDCSAQEGYPPLRVSGPSALMLDQPVRVRGDVSSQFLTALLMARPLVAAQGSCGGGSAACRWTAAATALQRAQAQARRRRWSRCARCRAAATSFWSMASAATLRRCFGTFSPRRRKAMLSFVSFNASFLPSKDLNSTAHLALCLLYI